MIHLKVEIDIDRAAEEVFTFLEDAENNTKWLKGMRSARWTTAPPVRKGSTYEQVSAFLGREIRTSFEVTELEPRRLITIKSREGSSFPITVTRIVERAAPAACRVTEIVDGDARGFYAIASPLLKLMVQRTIRRDYRGLKRMLESAPSAASARP
jgi:uncharacterized membrane protein